MPLIHYLTPIMANLKIGNNIMSTTPMKWCEKTSELAKTLHAANMEKSHADANSTDALTAIGKAVAELVSHKGKVPTFHGVRAKLSSEGVYTPLQTSNKPKGGTVVAKTDSVDKLKKTLGIDVCIGTFTNANKADLELVVKRTAILAELSIHNASIDMLEQALEEKRNAEIDAIAGGVGVDDVAKAEHLTEDIVQKSDS